MEALNRALQEISAFISAGVFCSGSAKTTGVMIGILNLSSFLLDKIAPATSKLVLCVAQKIPELVFMYLCSAG
jgi:hypothetical protein